MKEKIKGMIKKVADFTKGNSKTIIIVAVVICLVVTTAMSLTTMVKLSSLSNDVRDYMGIADDVNQENDVTIAGQYVIRSTTDISDAYKEGDSSGLDDKQKEILDMASKILEEIITDEMTPYEKELAVYEWMTSNLSSDQGAFSVIPQTEADCDNPYGVLKYHNAVCVGYATTFRMFMQMLDIECMVVHDSSLSHSWDLVKLDDEWYHTDIYFDADNGNYQNFNMNDSRCEESHSWNKDFFPAATSLKYSICNQNKVKFKDPYKIPQLIYDAIQNKDKAFALVFKEKLDQDTATLCEAILQSVSSYVENGMVEPAISMTWQWDDTADNGYVAYVYIGYISEDTPEEQITPEQQQKIDESVQKVFGDIWKDEPIDYDMGEGDDDQYFHIMNNPKG